MSGIPSYAHHTFRPLDREADWDKPRRLNPEAKLASERWRVLVEGDPAVMDTETREDLLTNIAFCSTLDWLLVTSDPESLPWADPPPNLWILARVRTQAEADERIPRLLKVPAAVRGVLVEGCEAKVDLWAARYRFEGGWSSAFAWGRGVNWVAIAGDVGPDAKPCHIERACALIQQCREAGVSVWVDRLGSRPMYDTGYDDGGPALWPQKDPKGGDPAEWPVDLRVQDLPGEKSI